MPKRSRRQVSKTAAFMPAPRVTEFDPDYTYIKRDLRRIGTLAGSFLVILVVLAFILR